MADKKISQLTGATTPLAGTEVLPVVQSGSTVKVAVSDLTAGRQVDAEKFYASGTSAIPIEARRSVANNVCLGTLLDSPSASNTNYLTFGVDPIGSSVGYASGGAFLSTGANGAGTPRDLILHTYGNNNIVFARQNAKVGEISADGFKPIATKGIDFSANTGAAGETSALLDWYEEGLFVPTMTASTSGTVTLAFTTLAYTRVGRLVTVTGEITVDSVASPVGDISIGNLPFANSGLSQRASRTAFLVEAGSFTGAPTGVVQGFIDSNSSTVALRLVDDFVVSSPASNLQAGTFFRFCFSYMTA